MEGQIERCSATRCSAIQPKAASDWYCCEAAKVGGGESVPSSSKTMESDAHELQPPTVSTTPGATSSGSNTASGATSSGRLPRRAKLARRQTTQQDDESNQ